MPVADLFQPLIPVQIVGLLFVFATAWWLGRREERRLGLGAGAAVDSVPTRVISAEEEQLRRPRLFWANLLLTGLVMVVMIAGWVDPVVMFMLGTVVALCLNYPNVDAQRARIDAHAKTALTMASILLAAGVFTGIMQGTGMLKAMAEVAVAQIPAGHGKLIPTVVGLLSMPLSLLFDPDSFYFGPGVSARRAHHRFPGQPADSGDVPAGGLVQDRTGRSPALHHSIPVCRLGADDRDGVASGRLLK